MKRSVKEPSHVHHVHFYHSADESIHAPLFLLLLLLSRELDHIVSH